ncbi:MAG TPA: sulfite exporter TauE/SafE family protein [Candidatus Acidoferrales bacterium]|nr:sulfite exporter TauE/SafE family protein [Candidatus Acidoferrales bacterium]
MGAGALEVVLLGLAAGVLVGLMGVGGGIVVVPMLVHLIGFRQHLAQGTSLFLLLPPIGLGALREYWKSGDVDLRAGIVCACGALAGGYGGSVVALLIPARPLKGIFGIFLIIASLLLVLQTREGLRAADGQPVGGKG